LTTESSSPDAPVSPAEEEAPAATTTPEAATAPVTVEESSMEDMASLLESVGAGELRQLRRGEVVEGHVMAIERDGLLVDIGFKSEGVVPQQEMLSLGADPLTKVQVADAVLVYVTQPETAAGQVGLSIDRARGEQGWRVLQERFETGDVFESEITGFNKGGLLANVEGVNAFIPMSQVVGAKPGSDGANPLSAQVGRELQLKVIEINRRRNRVILSERAALQEWRAEQKDRLLDELTEGEIRTGTVASIRNFGVFVDLGGADGLVHLSELSWDRNAQPEDLFKIGDEVSVYILRVDKESKKIALSIRRASPEQWEQMITQYSVGDVVPGVITKLVPFGAFARLPGPVEGLVHVSEIVERRIAHPEEVLEDGDVVPLKIVRIEHDRHRLGLSLREARGEAELRGWQFDGDGRIMTLNDEAREKFGDETAAIEGRLEHRRNTETDQAATRAQEAASRPATVSGGGTTAAAAAPDAGPVLTAMQQAMQQAQARQDSVADPGTDAEVVTEVPEAEAAVEEAPEAEAEVPAEEVVAEVPEAEAAAEEAPEAEAEVPAEEVVAEVPEAEAAVEEAPEAEAEVPAEEVVAEMPEAEAAAEEAPEAEADESEETPAAD
jgi:small subunit ribosomal protein S1